MPLQIFVWATTFADPEFYQKAIPAAVITGILLADQTAGERMAASPAAARSLAELPRPLYEAVHTQGKAASAVFYLLLNPDAEVRGRQLEAVSDALGQSTVVQLRQWWDAGVRPAPEQRLPLLELAVPTMRLRPTNELQQIDALIDTLIRRFGHQFDSGSRLPVARTLEEPF